MLVRFVAPQNAVPAIDLIPSGSVTLVIWVIYCAHGARHWLIGPNVYQSPVVHVTFLRTKVLSRR